MRVVKDARINDKLPTRFVTVAWPGTARMAAVHGVARIWQAGV